MDLDRVDLLEMYSLPNTYQPPQMSELDGNSLYPNLNSIEYRHKTSDQTKVQFHRFIEDISVNSMGTIALSTNIYTGRIWRGALWGYKDFEDVDKADKELFKMNSAAPITNVKFIDNDMVSFHALTSVFVN